MRRVPQSAQTQEYGDMVGWSGGPWQAQGVEQPWNPPATVTVQDAGYVTLPGTLA